MNISRWKRADLLSTTGAAVAGAGLALLFADRLAPYATELLLAGIAVHGVAMALKHRLERDASTGRVVWVEAAYWICWAVLVGLIAFVAIRIR